jgi:chromosome segregation ATPase
VARPSQKQAVLKAVREDLLRAEVESPDVMPINFKAVGERTGFDRRTIRRHAEKEVRKAQEAQERNNLSAARQEEEAYRDRLREKDEEVAKWREQYEALLHRVTQMEHNALRLGIDPEALYADLTPVDRTWSRAGRGRRG